MADILQVTFSNIFCQMEIFEFQSNFIEIYSQGSN